MNDKENAVCQECKYWGNSIEQILGIFTAHCLVDNQAHPASAKYCPAFEPKEVTE